MHWDIAEGVIEEARVVCGVWGGQEGKRGHKVGTMALRRGAPVFNLRMGSSQLNKYLLVVVNCIFDCTPQIFTSTPPPAQHVAGSAGRCFADVRTSG